MTQRLATYIGKRVSVTETDGRLIVGRLRGVDQFANIILDGAEVFALSSDKAPQILPVGSTVIRGDNIAMIGLVNTELEAGVKRDELRFPAPTTSATTK